MGTLLTTLVVSCILSVPHAYGTTREGGVETPMTSWPGLPVAGGRGSWVENRGQWPGMVDFVAQLSGALVRAEPGALVLEKGGETPGSRSVVRMSFEGASESAGWEGREELEGVYHFYLGNEPGRWQRNVRAYGSLRCNGLYPGIDLVLRSRDGGLKYDLLVAPGAELEAVRIRCDGLAGEVGGCAEGLELSTATGLLTHRDGACWQLTQTGEKRPITCLWREDGDSTLVVECPERDASLPLVIDPDLLWSTYLGSAPASGQGDAGRNTAVNRSGDVVVVGRADGLDFPQTPGSISLPGTATHNAFATKLRSSDGALVYSIVFGGSLNQTAWNVALDDEGIATVVGSTFSQDFPVTRGAFDTTASTVGTTGFVAQFSALGDELRFCTFLGGSSTPTALWGVGSDPSGNVVVAGIASGTDYPTTPGVPGAAYGGGINDAVVSKLDASGSALLWSTFLGGSREDEAYDLEVGSDGAVTVTGIVVSVGFPTTPGAFMTTKATANSVFAFMTRMPADGSELSWSSYLGGQDPGNGDRSFVHGLGVDASGSPVVTGTTESLTFPTTSGALQETPPNQNGGGFVARFLPDGSDLIYATYLSGPTSGSPQSVAVDASGVAVVGGAATVGFPTTPGSYDPTGGNGNSDFFVARLSPQGDRLFYSTFLGGPTTDANEGIALSPEGRVTVTGWVI